MYSNLKLLIKDFSSRELGRSWTDPPRLPGHVVRAVALYECVWITDSSEGIPVQESASGKLEASADGYDRCQTHEGYSEAEVTGI